MMRNHQLKGVQVIVAEASDRRRGVHLSHAALESYPGISSLHDEEQFRILLSQILRGLVFEGV
jgi:hypothetical protein